jgi:hypothetical protein
LVGPIEEELKGESIGRYTVKKVRADGNVGTHRKTREESPVTVPVPPQTGQKLAVADGNDPYGLYCSVTWTPFRSSVDSPPVDVGKTNISKSRLAIV